MFYIMQEMTWPEVRDALQKVKLAILPVGSHEQHGPHLAMSTDIAVSEVFARKLTERTHPVSLLAPPLNYGISIHHMPFPGTLTLQPETFEKILLDVAASFRDHGIRKLFVVNGHGGNQHVLNIASMKMRRDLGVRMAYTLWPTLGGGAIADLVQGRQIGHACIFETSMIMYLRPNLVRKDALTEGELQPPLYGDVSITGIEEFDYWNEYTTNGALQGAPEATPEIGEKITEMALEKAVAFVHKFAELREEDGPAIS